MIFDHEEFSQTASEHVRKLWNSEPVLTSRRGGYSVEPSEILHGRHLIASAEYRYSGLEHAVGGMEPGNPELYLGIDHSRYRTFVLYPRAEHAAGFASSAGSLLPGGPWLEFPGAVGVLHAYVDPHPGRKGASTWTISLLQGCFKKGKQYGVGHAVYKQYLGWKEALIGHAFAQAERNGAAEIRLSVDLADRTYAETDEGGRRVWKSQLVKLGAGNEEAFRKAAAARGFTVHMITPEIYHGLRWFLVATREK